MADKLTATLRRNDGSELYVDLEMPEAVYVGVLVHNNVYYRWRGKGSEFVFVETLALQVHKVREER